MQSVAHSVLDSVSPKYLFQLNTIAYLEIIRCRERMPKSPRAEEQPSATPPIKSFQDGLSLIQDIYSRKGASLGIGSRGGGFENSYFFLPSGNLRSGRDLRPDRPGSLWLDPAAGPVPQSVVPENDRGRLFLI